MVLYHGSNQEVAAPRVVDALHTLDFGPGFYTTANFAQAKNFALRITPKRGVGVPTVSRYEFDEKGLQTCRTLDFPLADGHWLDFVNQYVFKSARALEALKFIGSEAVHE